MEQEEVIEKWREIEREQAIGWCGASASDRPAEALRALAAKHREAGGDHETSFTGLDSVSRSVAICLCRRYGLQPFRRKGQRSTTVLVQGPQPFVDKVYWPILDQGLDVVGAALQTWVKRVVDACIHDDLPDEGGC